MPAPPSAQPSTFAHHVASFIALSVSGVTLMSRQLALQSEYALSASDWGWCLLALGAGAVSGYPITRWMLVNRGSRSLLVWSGGGLGLGLALLPWWPGGLPVLLLALFCQGLLGNGLNVSINSQAAAFEQRSGLHCMGRLHALFYIGVTAAAVTSSAAVAAGVSAHVHFACVGALIAGGCIWLAQRFVPDLAAPRSDAGTPHPPSKEVLGLGLLGAVGGIAAGAVDGWAPLVLHSSFGASPSTAAASLVCFSASMFVGRMLTDQNARRFGPRRLVRVGTLLAATALLGMVVLPSLPMAFFAIAVAGLGQAAIFPILFSAAGRLGGHAISGVASISATSGLIGPTLLGRIAAIGSPAAVFVGVAGALVLASWQARVLPGRAGTLPAATRVIGA